MIRPFSLAPPYHGTLYLSPITNLSHAAPRSVRFSKGKGNNRALGARPGRRGVMKAESWPGGWLHGCAAGLAWAGLVWVVQYLRREGAVLCWLGGLGGREFGLCFVQQQPMCAV